MFTVKTIGLIVCMSICWVLTSRSLYSAAGDPARRVRSAQPATDSLSWLALGDSYTIGQSVEEKDRYPVQAVRMLLADGKPYRSPEIIAVTGWTTADLQAAMPPEPPPSPYQCVSLLIGVNDQYQGLSQTQYKERFTGLLEQSIRLAGNRPSHVIVLSIPDYSVTPFAKGSNTALIAAQIDSFNAMNRQVARDRQVHYLDITGESRKALNDPSLIAGDNLHFSGKEYAIWATMMKGVMATFGR